jgi:hypothetical protein
MGFELTSYRDMKHGRREAAREAGSFIPIEVRMSSRMALLIFHYPGSKFTRDNLREEHIKIPIINTRISQV